MAVYELWRQEGHGVTFSFQLRDLCADALAMAVPDEEPPVLVWTVDADTYDEAMTKYHRHMGWEPYVPMER